MKLYLLTPKNISSLGYLNPVKFNLSKWFLHFIRWRVVRAGKAFSAGLKIVIFSPHKHPIGNRPPPLFFIIIIFF